MPALQHPRPTPLAPGERLKIGYVSSDFGNHPLSHLMASVFGSHDRSKVCFPHFCLSKPRSNELHTQEQLKLGCKKSLATFRSCT